MPGIHHLALHFKRYGFAHRVLYLFASVVFFWALFDGIISYVTPLVITQGGLSETAMGVIYASSSVFGAIFDLLLSRILTNVKFRITIFFMLLASFVQPLLLWQAKSIPLFIVAMAVWGLYYDLSNFGTFDFVGRKMAPAEHVSSFGVIEVFKSLGYLVAPLIAGILVTGLVDIKAFGAAWAFLVLAFACFVVLLMATRTKRQENESGVRLRPVNFIRKIAIWKKVGKKIFPVLFLTALFFIYDAFFWTIGPIYVESLKLKGFLSGSILTAYTLPTLIFGWFMGTIVAKLGKTKAIYLPFILGFLILIGLPFTNSFSAILLIVFVSSTLTTISLTTIRGLYADFIHEVPKEETDIEALGDFSTNIGYVVGPVAAGFLADKAGNAQSFAILGIVGFVLTLILFVFSGGRSFRLD